MARGVRVSGSIEINRPVKEVFDFVADQRNEPLYNPDMLSSELVTDGPIGVGSCFRARTLSRGKPVDMVIEVTRFERPRRMGSTTHLDAMDLDGTLTFDPIHAGTRMSWSWNIHPTGPLLWFKPFVGVIGGRNERRIWAALKQFLEGPSNDREPAT